MKIIRNLLIISFAIMFSFGLSAYGDGHVNYGFGTSGELQAVITEDANNDARVRVAHLVPGAGAVDVLVNGSAAIEGLAYQDVTEYIPLAVGTYNFTVVLEDTTTTIFSPVITPVAADTDYTVAAVGAATGTVSVTLEPLLLVDDNSPVADGESRVRVVHASADTPEVDVNASVTTGLLSDVPFKAAAYLDDLAAGTYDLGVYVANTTTLGIDLTGTALGEGNVATVFAVGTLDGGDAFALEPLVILDSNNDANLRVIHAVPDAPAVDVLANGSTAFSTLNFRDGSDYAALDVDVDYNFTVTPTGASVSVLEVLTPLASNTDYTVAAVGNLSTIEPLLLADNNTAVSEGNTRVRVVHASPNAPAVDITLADGTVLVADLAFKEAGYIEVAAGTYDLEVRAAGTNVTVLELDGTALAEGSVYTVFAMGYLLGPNTITEIVTETTTITEDGETITVTEGGDAPGFGIFLVISSFAAIILVLRRRQ